MVERIESLQEVETYLSQMRYALDHGAAINIQYDRRVDNTRDIIYTNRFTLTDLFPNEDPVNALKRELRSLTVKSYLRTVPDINHPERSDMREFGKVYDGKGDVYIKIRVELLPMDCVFVMSCHYATIPFSQSIFPYA